jgi:hypothetical protein
MLLVSVGLSTPLLAQAQNTNQAAVDTLTKDVAMAVFGNLRGDKAAEILNQLAMCSDGCDAVSTIKNVGGWDAVGVKMDELGRLKSTAPFQVMSPGDANAAIRREFSRFYNRYKNDKNYGVPLNQAVQAQILAKIDGMLPPNAALQTAPVAGGQPVAGQVEQADVADENANINSQGIQISQLQRAVKEERENRLWMIILSAIIGLLVGAGIVYFMLYRALKNEVDRLTQENAQLSNNLDSARRQKVANEPRPQQATNRPKLDTYAAPESARPVDPVESKSVPDTPPVAPPAIRSGTPVPGAAVQSEPMPDPVVAVSEPAEGPGVPPLPAPARNEVFYFPPPDPNGQFDTTLRTDMLSPESAYWFSTSADSPDVATFRFEAEPGRVARFLTYRNYMIEPACDSENSYSPHYTRIVNRRNGEAVLENGAWRVKTKALIRYE